MASGWGSPHPGAGGGGRGLRAVANAPHPDADGVDPPGSGARHTEATAFAAFVGELTSLGTVALRGTFSRGFGQQLEPVLDGVAHDP